MEPGSEQITPKEIPWWRALLVFPLAIVPFLLLRALVHGTRLALRGGMAAWAGRPRDAGAPRPLGAAGLLLSWVLAGPVLAIWFVASGAADRVAASGLVLIALATVCVSPGLLSLDVLARLDRWWLASDLPSYQLAFAHHARRGLAFLLRGALFILAATFIVGALSIVVGLLPFPNGMEGVVDRSLSVLGLTFAIALSTAALAFFLRLLVGAPTEFPQKAVPVVLAAEGLQDPERQRTLVRVAAVLFAGGTVLSFVAVVFLHGS